MKPSILTFIAVLSAATAEASTTIRIMPPERGVLAVGQRFDIRVEATSDTTEPPAGLRVTVNGRDITARNMLEPGVGGERGAGGTGTGGGVPAAQRAARAAPNTTNFLLRGYSVGQPGPLAVEAWTADGARRMVALSVEAWAGRGLAPRARNIIFLLGDGMGTAHRTAARIVSRGVQSGKAVAPLAMDTLDVTGMVMTSSLNAIITDSSPGMAAYSTGQKNNNNQEGVFPDNTSDSQDNPRIEYLGELLRRTRGTGFNVGIVTTADVTDSTPGANGAHTSDRYASAAIAAQFFDERRSNAITVLMGGGSRHFLPRSAGGGRPDERRLTDEFAAVGFARVSNRHELQALIDAPQPPTQVLGLFHPSQMPVAFDKVGAGRYSDELALEKNAAVRDAPMLEDMTRLALRSLAAHSPSGFYLMVEGASIDKRAHGVDAERTIWDTIEFDRAVQVALDFARRTNSDGDASNDTLVIVTADHETGGLGIIGIGNERYAPKALGRAVRDYAAVFRFEPQQELSFYTNYEVDDRGFPIDPDPSKKLLLGWAAGPDHYENWISNRLQLEPTVRSASQPAAANPARDGAGTSGDNKAVDGTPIPGFLVQGTIENGATPCGGPDRCPADTASVAQTISGHTASDVPLSASGPGAWQFTGVYENTDVFLKMLRSSTGTYPAAPGSSTRRNR